MINIWMIQPNDVISLKYQTTFCFYIAKIHIKIVIALSMYNAEIKHYDYNILGNFYSHQPLSACAIYIRSPARLCGIFAVKFRK